MMGLLLQRSPLHGQTIVRSLRFTLTAPLIHTFYVTPRSLSIDHDKSNESNESNESDLKK